MDFAISEACGWRQDLLEAKAQFTAELARRREQTCCRLAGLRSPPAALSRLSTEPFACRHPRSLGSVRVIRLSLPSESGVAGLDRWTPCSRSPYGLTNPLPMRWRNPPPPR